MLEFVIDLLKITVPAIIVGATAYYIIRNMLGQQLHLQSQKMREKRQSTVLPLKLQAYERLSMLCERIAIPGLVMRIQSEDMNCATFKVALLMAIQQEFEHNVTQQIYVSDQLWEIIKATRNDLYAFIDLVSEKVDKKEPAHHLAGSLLAYLEQRESDPIHTAQSAIRKEAALLF